MQYIFYVIFLCSQTRSLPALRRLIAEQKPGISQIQFPIFETQKSARNVRSAPGNNGQAPPKPQVAKPASSMPQVRDQAQNSDQPQKQNSAHSQQAQNNGQPQRQNSTYSQQAQNGNQPQNKNLAH